MRWVPEQAWRKKEKKNLSEYYSIRNLKVKNVIAIAKKNQNLVLLQNLVQTYTVVSIRIIPDNNKWGFVYRLIVGKIRATI